MKQKFTIKMEQSFDVDLSEFDFPSHYTERDIEIVLIRHYFDECGYDAVQLETEHKNIKAIDLVNVLRDNLKF